MYENKLKKALFEKIREWGKVNEKISQIEDEAKNLSFDELIESNDEYGALCMQAEDFRSEIEELLIDTKYFPLLGLTDKQKMILDCFSQSPSLDYDKNIEKHLDLKLLELKDDMKERLGKVKPLHLTVNIDPRTRYFYNEVIRCFIYGAFEASCVLCRAIAEVIAKRFIEYKGYSDLLVGKETQLKKLTVPGILTEKLSVQKDVIEIYSKITRKADGILHERSEKAEEKDALESVKLLQSFIEKFPKTL